MLQVSFVAMQIKLIIVVGGTPSKTNEINL